MSTNLLVYPISINVNHVARPPMTTTEHLRRRWKCSWMWGNIERQLMDPKTSTNSNYVPMSSLRFGNWDPKIFGLAHWTLVVSDTSLPLHFCVWITQNWNVYFSPWMGTRFSLCDSYSTTISLLYHDQFELGRELWQQAGKLSFPTLGNKRE